MHKLVKLNIPCNHSVLSNYLQDYVHRISSHSIIGTRVICSNKSGLMSQIIECNDSVSSDFLQDYVHSCRIPIIGHGIHLCMLLVYIIQWNPSKADTIGIKNLSVVARCP